MVRIPGGAHREQAGHRRRWRGEVIGRAALALALFPVLLTGCDFVLSNTVPDFFPYVVEELDLDGVLPSRIREITFAAIPTGTENQPIFVLVVRPDDAGPDTVVMVDDTIGSVRVSQESTGVTRFDTRPFRRLGGLVQVGNLVYNPELRRLINAPRSDGDFRPIISTELDDEYYLVSLDDPATLHLDVFDFDFLPIGEYLVPLVTFDAALTVEVREVETRMYDAAVADFVVRGENDETWFFSAELSVAPVDDAVRIPASVRLDSVQRTPRGILARRDDTTLVRISRESGEVLDSFQLTDKTRRHQLMPVVFDPAGEFYLLLDAERRILYKVAPWW